MIEKKIIENILKIEAIQKSRYKKNVLERYNTGEKIHKKQLEFHKSKKRNRWVFGGNRSGKTECGAVEAIYMTRGIHPYRENKKNVSGWVVSPSFEVQREVSQAKILNYLNPDWIVNITMQEGSKSNPSNGVIDTIYLRNSLGGVSKIGFKSSEQSREKFQGASLDFVWFDEEPPKDIYEECKMRILDKKGDIFGTMTPLKGLTWVYDDIYLNKYNDKEVFTLFMEWNDNPYLDKDEIENFTRTFAEDTLDSRRYGRFRVNEGLVYKEFDANVHIIDPIPLDKEWQATFAIDPGLNNPLSCHFYYVDYDGNIYVTNEHYERGQDIYYHSQVIKEIAEKIEWKRNFEGNLEGLIDSAANQKTLSGTKSVCELFYENGLSLNSKVNKDIFTGISRLKSIFAQIPPRIFIFRDCVNLIREIKSYWWGKGDSPIKKDDHALDELRYFIMSRPEPPNLAKPTPKIIKYKEKLIKTLPRRKTE